MVSTTDNDNNNNDGTRPGKGEVKVKHYQKLDPAQEDMKEWPNGKLILDALTEEFPHHELTPEQKDEAYWQAAFRLSLLKKYGHCPQEELENPFVEMTTQGKHHRILRLSEQDIRTIDSLWQEQWELANQHKGENNSGCSEHEDSDLREFLSTAKSNGRQLQWSIMDIGPACQFKLHAHPNIEVVYCVKGALHEIRMEGKPVTRVFEKQNEDENVDNLLPGRLEGPDLSLLGRPWKFDTLAERSFLVNEVGSIHKSFAATDGDGVQLLCLWGGSHADVPSHQEPHSVDVQQALETMDERLCSGGCSSSTQIQETFLPRSDN